MEYFLYDTPIPATVRDSDPMSLEGWDIVCDDGSPFKQQLARKLAGMRSTPTIPTPMKHLYIFPGLTGNIQYDAHKPLT